MRSGTTRKAVSPSFEVRRSTLSALAARIVAALRGAGPPLLFGLRMCHSRFTSRSGFSSTAGTGLALQRRSSVNRGWGLRCAKARVAWLAL
jgi:hypothetical protein